MERMARLSVPLQQQMKAVKPSIISIQWIRYLDRLTREPAYTI
jgi:hypothetical protein